ncbi:MAG: threonylcarbamoyl-AMP synthase, partial [Clostridia bacterium]|nr:threonylcarbamoyl-AMP synthase [Clostridia bacterium]
METLLLRGDENGIKKAAEILKSGGLCAIPTETVYGLAANSLDPQAVEKIFAAKGRPQDNPLIIHIAETDEIYRYVTDFCQKAKKLTEKFWPGPLTVILPKSKEVPDVVTCGMDSVAVRMPSNPIAHKIIKECKVALAAPSANISGRPSPTSFEHVYEDMNGKIDAIVDGGQCRYGLESTVISFLTDPPRLLRPGAVTPENIEETIGEIVIDDAVKNKLAEGQKVLSPGMKYKHYAPK